MFSLFYAKEMVPKVGKSIFMNLLIPEARSDCSFYRRHLSQEDGRGALRVLRRSVLGPGRDGLHTGDGCLQHL